MTPANYFSFHVGLLVENQRGVTNLVTTEYITLYTCITNFGDALVDKITSYYEMDPRVSTIGG
jgi:hypothetical protein